jgi:hypothetical protein
MANGFRSAYIGVVRGLVLSGYTTNAEIASVLRKTEAQVKKWRQAVPAFNEACEMTLIQANVMTTNYAFKRANEDDASNRYWNDRRNPAFMPKQKVDHTSNGNTLAALLAEHGRMDMDEARDRGLIIDAEDFEEIHDRTDAIAYSDEEELDEYDEDGQPLR